MVSLEAFSELLEVLYSAPLDQEQWQRFLSLLCEYTRGKNGYFLCADSRLGLSVRANSGDPQAIQNAAGYNQQYADDDPYHRALVRNGRLGVFHGDDVFPDESLLQTDLYRTLLAPAGIRHVTLIPLTLSVRRFEAISIWRAPEQGPMGEDGIRLLNLLVPHIQQVLQIRQVLGITREHLAGVEAVANASSTATFLLTHDGRLIHGNSAADILLSNGKSLAVVNDMLAATDPASQGNLRNIYKKAASSNFTRSTEPPTYALLIPRSGRRRPLQLLVTPLPQTLRARSGADIVVLVSDPDATLSFPDGVLCALYNLTAAEIEVANGLLMGYSLDEIAGLRHVKLGTVRNQMKSLLSKTGAGRQSDLVRLLMTLPRSTAAA
jgi:DNA-binding CsgD family transcriptional regulator